MEIFRTVYRTWFTGVLYCLAALGYVFYTLLVVIRMAQTKKILITISVLILLLLSIAAVVLYFLVPFGQPGKEIVLFVEPGTSVREVAKTLKEREVIDHARVFLLWVKVNKLDRGMQAGKYTFFQNEGIVSAARKLQSAEPIEESVTVPEGCTIEQTAVLIAEVFTVDTTKFAELCTDTSFIAALGLAQTSLEGYLFPDTYRFPPDADAEQIIARMVRQFFTVYNTIPQTDISRGFSRHQLVTLASIVEEEATVAEERKRIAGVFHNRLKRNWPLGADPTVRYALKKFSGPLRVSELQNPSPYNTRVHTGLPPGPICSPGKGSLEAAIAPMETDELYFVAKWDGSGEHDFSKTNSEHERKKLKIRKENYLRNLKKARENK